MFPAAPQPGEATLMMISPESISVHPAHASQTLVFIAHRDALKKASLSPSFPGDETEVVRS